MRSVRRQDTAPELALRRLLHAKGLRFRLHVRGEPGTPDLLLPKRATAIFVHGCFWHGHDCTRGARMPKQNAEYWRAKIARNVARDSAALKALRADGWRTLVVWECETRNAAALSRKLDSFLKP